MRRPVRHAYYGAPTARQAANDLGLEVAEVLARCRRPQKGGREPRLSPGELAYLRELKERRQLEREGE